MNDLLILFGVTVAFGLVMMYVNIHATGSLATRWATFITMWLSFALAGMTVVRICLKVN